MFVKTSSVIHHLSNIPDTATPYLQLTFSPIFSTVMSLKEVTDGLPQAILRLNSKDTLSIFMQTIVRVF